MLYDSRCSRLPIALLASLICCHAGEAQPRPGVADCEVIVPTGSYEPVFLDIAFAGLSKDAKPITCAGGLRNGRMAVSDSVGLREAGGFLERKGDALTGRFRRLNVDSPIPRTAAAGDIVVDARIAADGTLSGTATLGALAGKVSGRIITEAQLAKTNAMPREAAWPAFQGPLAGGCSAVPSGVATIESVGDIRPLWRCEEIDIGRGMGNINRFMNNWGSASTIRSGSGCASPLLADGRIYMKYFIPSEPQGRSGSDTKLAFYGQSEADAAAAMLEAARKDGFAAVPMYALEKASAVADDVVLCMDAATGKTIWKAIARRRGINWQYHKAGPFNLSPAIGNGRIFAVSTSGWISAFEAASGKPLWEVPAAYDDSIALLALGDILVAPAGRAWGGYDGATGKLLWTAGNAREMSTFTAWRRGDRNFLIGIESGGIICLDAASGKEIWKLPVIVITGGRGHGPGGITISGDRMLVYRNKGSGRKGDPVIPALVAYQLDAAGAEQKWEMQEGDGTGKAAAAPAGKGEEDGDAQGKASALTHRENVPVVVHGRYVFTNDLRTVDLETGKVIATSSGPRPSNGGYVQAMDDLVLVRGDGTHGRVSCGWYKVGKDGSIRSLNAESWLPPIGGGTTSYHHPIFYPMGAGRIFFRQDDGIYCWDLRVQAR